MCRTSNWDHVDLFFEYAGLESDSDKHCRAALHDFRMAAYDADKPSQISTDLMDLQGEGVPRNPGHGMSLGTSGGRARLPQVSSHRADDFPPAAATTTAAGRLRVFQLAVRYADKATKPHVIRDMRVSMMMVNPTGHVPLRLISQTGGNAILAWPSTRDPDNASAAENCSGDLAWRRDADSYFSARDAQWQPLQGHVTVHDLQPVTAASAPAHPQIPAFRRYPAAMMKLSGLIVRWHEACWSLLASMKSIECNAACHALAPFPFIAKVDTDVYPPPVDHRSAGVLDQPDLPCRHG